MKSFRSHNKYYWLSQAAGWGAYALLNIGYYLISERLELNAGTVATVLLSSGFAIVLTHIFRGLAIKYNIFGLQPPRLMLTVVLANVAMAAVFLTFTWLLEFLFTASAVTEYELSAGIILLGMLNSGIWFALWSLIYFSIKYFKNYKQQEIKTLKWEGAIKDFELNKLRSQLNPHFVFNALNSIRALVDEDPVRAKSSITNLSNLLRNALLADRKKTITLSEEMQTVYDYINLERTRFEERLVFEANIEPECNNVQVPPMMIQTIVENAVKHGISQRVKGGTIVLNANIIAENLTITITNDGTYQTDKQPEGFGVINTKQRLELLYDGKASFGLMPLPNEKVIATLILPKNANLNY